MEKQEELAKNEYKLKRQANHASVINAYINLERNAAPAADKSLKEKDIINSESEEDEKDDYNNRDHF